MKVLLNQKNIVLAVADEIVKVENGFLIPKTKTIYTIKGLKVVETELKPRVQQDKLVDGKVVPNDDYKTKEEILKFEKERQLKNLVDKKIITKAQYEKISD
jgi:hypothetical protein